MVFVGCGGKSMKEILELNNVQKFESISFYNSEYLDLEHGIIIENLEDLLTFKDEYYASLDLKQYDKDFFKINSLVVVGFYYSSTDSDININQPLKIENDVLYVTIDFYGPEDRTYDLKFVAFAVEVSKKNIQQINEVKILLNNTFKRDLLMIQKQSNL